MKTAAGRSSRFSEVHGSVPTPHVSLNSACLHLNCLQMIQKKQLMATYFSKFELDVKFMSEERCRKLFRKLRPRPSAFFEHI